MSEESTSERTRSAGASVTPEGRMEGGMEGQKDGGMDKRREGQKDGRTEGWKNGGRDGQKDRWTEEKMDRCRPLGCWIILSFQIKCPHVQSCCASPHFLSLNLVCVVTSDFLMNCVSFFFYHSPT